jgi:hypothetical protein
MADRMIVFILVAFVGSALTSLLFLSKGILIVLAMAPIGGSIAVLLAACALYWQQPPCPPSRPPPRQGPATRLQA